MCNSDRRRLAPASTIVEKFTSGNDAGVKVLAEVCGVDQSRVYRWMYGAELNGTDGVIPSRHHRKIVAAARARGIPLSGDDLIGTDCVAA